MIGSAESTLRVVTGSGRVYHLDTEGKRYHTEGDQPMSFEGNAVPDPHHEWTDYMGLGVDNAGRLVLVDRDGGWRVSTRVEVGLDELLAVLDK